MTNFEQGRLSAFIDCLQVILNHSKDPTTEERNPLRVLKDVSDEVRTLADSVAPKKEAS